MFDTVTLFTQIHVNPIKLTQYKSYTYLKGGELRTNYTYEDTNLKIEYKDFIHFLEIECSIPKFLYGNNVILIKEQDIPLFFQRLHDRLNELMGVEVHSEDWKVKRVDVCWNFQVGDQLDSYVKELGRVKIPYTVPHTYGINETAVHENDSRRISFYNKSKECKRNKRPKKIVNQAAGILRFEINVRGKNLTKYSKARKATDFLTQHFFDYITKPILERIHFPDEIQGLTVAWIKSQSYSIQQIETALAFNLMRQCFSELELEELYSSQTYNKRKKLANLIQFPAAKSLAPLVIEPKQTS